MMTKNFHLQTDNKWELAGNHWLWNRRVERAAFLQCVIFLFKMSL